jgi:hypothetical protein
MKQRFTLLLLIVAVAFTGVRARAAYVPEKLVPRDTILLMTIPDMDQAAAKFRETSGYRLFQEPFMKPLIERAKKDITAAIAENLGEDQSETLMTFLGSVKGQLTFAVSGSPKNIMSGKAIRFAVIWDAKEQRDAARKAIESSLGKADKMRVVREKVPGGEILKMITEGEDDAAFFGFSDSLIVLGADKQSVADVFRRRTGDLGESLAENLSFREDHARFFRNSQMYMWGNLEAVVDGVIVGMAEQPGNAAGGNPLMAAINPGQAMKALGLTGLKSLAAGIQYDRAGSNAELFLKVPQSVRKGLLKIFVTEPKTTVPPRFIAGDIATYSRWRKSGKDIIDTIEATIREAVPMMSGFVSMMIDQAGKANDPNFDFRREFIGNLGDDIIQYSRASKDITLESLSSPPTMYLLGSGNPKTLLEAARKAQGGMGMPGLGAAKEEDFLGNRVLVMPAGVKLNLDGGKPESKYVYLTTSRGYLAIATDRDLLEDFIRGGSKGAPLSELPHFRELAQKAGGLDTGWLFFENPQQSIELLLRSLKADPKAWQKIIGVNPFQVMKINVGDTAGADKKVDEQEQMVTDYIKLLPTFEQIRKYLGYTVGTVSSDADGILVRAVSPDSLGE